MLYLHKRHLVSVLKTDLIFLTNNSVNFLMEAL